MEDITDKIITSNFEDLNQIKFDYNIKIGLVVNYKNVKYEFILNLIKDDNEIVVLGSGFLDKDQAKKFVNKPIFARQSWATEIKHNVIYYNDPTLYDYNTLKGGWGIGTDSNWHLENIAEIIKKLSENIVNYDELEIPKYSNILFYGSSMGGFMSIILSILVKNSTSLADSPQVNLKTWWYWDQIKEAIFKDLPEHDINKCSYKLNIIDMIQKEKFIPNTYIVFDCTDDRDWNTQISDFIKELPNLPYTNNNERKIHIRFDGKNKGHAILPKKETLQLIETTIESKNCEKEYFSVDDIKSNMISEFKNKLDTIYDFYSDNKITYKRFIHNKNLYSNSLQTARIDIKNSGNKDNTIEVLNKVDLNIKYPGWFNKNDGKGCVIQTTNNHTKLSIKAINDGKLLIYLRGVDYRSIEKQRIPVYLNFKKFTINGEEIFDENKLVWHDSAYIYEINCSNNEIFNIEVEYETIYDYLPKLDIYLDSFNAENEEDINDNYVNIMKYLSLDNESENKTSEINELDIIKDKIEDIQSANISLNSKNHELEQKMHQLSKDYDKILDSYNIMLNNILINHKLEPKKLLKSSHELTTEILDFVSNVCKKYDLKWWLYAGSLLGAVRHEGFIPWDDDCDINMMRDDYDKFLEVVDDEIKSNNLQDNLSVKNDSIANGKSFLPFIKVEYRVNGKLFGFIDIMPSDYITDVIDNAKEVYTKEYFRVRHDLKNGKDRKQVLEESFKLLHVSKTKTDLIMTGIEDTYKNFAIFKYDNIFPLVNLKFEDKSYPCPKDYDLYLKTTMGENYMKIPKVIYDHGFHDYLLTHENVFEKFDTHLKKIKEVNKNYQK